MADNIRRSGAERTAEDNINNIERQSMLFDFYGVLLSDSQNEVMALYHEDNLSLSEIAEELGQSRQAVHYTLKKAERALKGYEDKLGLIAGYQMNQMLAGKAREILSGTDSKISRSDREELLSIIEKLSE